MPASIRAGPLLAKPRFKAILSAVLKPIPFTSRIILYGSVSRMSFAELPYFLTNLRQRAFRSAAVCLEGTSLLLGQFSVLPKLP